MLSKGQEASRDIHYTCFTGLSAKWQRVAKGGNDVSGRVTLIQHDYRRRSLAYATARGRLPKVDVGNALQVMLLGIHSSVSEVKQYIDGQVKEGLNARDYKVINAERTSPSTCNITAVIINFHFHRRGGNVVYPVIENRASKDCPCLSGRILQKHLSRT